MNNLPQKIKLTIHEEEIDFYLTDKREIKYHGRTKTSNESLWRADKLEDNEVFYQTEWGWGVFVKIEERELSLKERLDWVKMKYPNIVDEKGWVNLYKDDKLITAWFDYYFSGNIIPTKLITLTYNNETIEIYE